MIDLKHKILLHRQYFEKGYYLSRYLVIMIGLFGVSSSDVSKTLWLGILYALFCYIFGWWFCNKGWLDAENDIANQFNPFVKNVNQKLKIPSKA